jgi:calcineurin-like phosphoesterase family protein
MKRVWFTSDYHMGHRNIIGLCERPFVDVDTMECEIIARHNALVGADDDVYDLGDFAFRCTAEHAADCMRKLNGRRVVLWGNHNKPLRQAYRKGLLDDLVGCGKVTFVGDPDPQFQTGLRINIEGRPIILSHYAQRTWQGAFRGAWHLYGHSHGNLSSFRMSFDVGVDAHDFCPISCGDVKEQMSVITEEFSEN